MYLPVLPICPEVPGHQQWGVVVEPPGCGRGTFPRDRKQSSLSLSFVQAVNGWTRPVHLSNLTSVRRRGSDPPALSSLILSSFLSQRALIAQYI